MKVGDEVLVRGKISNMARGGRVLVQFHTETGLDSKNRAWVEADAVEEVSRKS
jgi:hypothetical protein